VVQKLLRRAHHEARQDIVLFNAHEVQALLIAVNVVHGNAALETSKKLQPNDILCSIQR
jgi:hypothetical protein